MKYTFVVLWFGVQGWTREEFDTLGKAKRAARGLRRWYEEVYIGKFTTADEDMVIISEYV